MKYKVVLTTLDRAPAASTTVTIEAASQEAAEEQALELDPESLLWMDDRGNRVRDVGSQDNINIAEVTDAPPPKTQAELTAAHGTPDQFAEAVNKAADQLFCTTDEANAAIAKYREEWNTAPAAYPVSDRPNASS
jgi:hypothetical protein